MQAPPNDEHDKTAYVEKKPGFNKPFFLKLLENYFQNAQAPARLSPTQLMPVEKSIEYCNLMTVLAHEIVLSCTDNCFYGSEQYYTFKSLIAACADTTPLKHFLSGLLHHSVANKPKDQTQQREASLKAKHKYEGALYSVDRQQPCPTWERVIGLYASLQYFKLMQQYRMKMSNEKLEILVRRAGVYLSTASEDNPFVFFYKSAVPHNYADLSVPLFDYNTHTDLLFDTASRCEKDEVWWDVRARELLPYYKNMEYVSIAHKSDALATFIQVLDETGHDNYNKAEFCRAQQQSFDLLMANIK
jgi:hypothetical protein